MTRRRGPDYDPTPLYLRVASTLRERIGGTWPVGFRLPAEHALAAEFHVTIGTIRRAVGILEAEGLLARYQGKGTDVLEAPRGVDQHLTGSMQDLLSFKPEVTVKVLQRKTLVPSLDIQRILRLSEGEKRVHLQRIASFNGSPIALTDSYVPTEYDDMLTDTDLNNRTLISLLWTKCRVGFSRAEQSVSARIAAPATARALKVPIASPLIVLARTDFDSREQPILFTTCQYRADRYSIDVSLGPLERERENAAYTASSRPTRRRA